ncbi:hypothetical protein ACN47E_000248 [Coniothyrium glycines]
MQPRFYSFAAAFKVTGTSRATHRPMAGIRLLPFVCRNCQKNFSTSGIFRQAAKAVGKTVEKEQQYKSRLLIYDAGDARTTWISFWKAMALLQFGTTLVFGVPPLWNNTNQPDPNVRKFQAILVGVLGTIPTLTLAYMTAPFVHQIFLQIPEYARGSRVNLMHFARSLQNSPRKTANTKIEFVTLRIFPFRKTTAAFIHELRALPPMRMRLANIELPKTEEWAERQRSKGIFKRMFEVLKEPRFKFYVKEGRAYTMKTGVPGVWEEVAKRIQEQTVTGDKEAEKFKTTTSTRPAMLPKPTRIEATRQTVRRQTSRTTR